MEHNMLSQVSRSHALAILAGIATGALVGIGLGIALFVYEAKHDMEASY
ncbi:membrane protein [Mycobacterium phage prophiT37-1]|nr:membrane protein [Mycobacterium phage prophiT37-1]